MRTFDQLQPGEKARIVGIDGGDAVAVRLMEMGLIEDTEITYLGPAPFGDPLKVLVEGGRLAIRKSEARRIQIA